MDAGDRVRRLMAERDELRERIRQLEENWTAPLIAPGAFGLTLAEVRVVSALLRVDFMPRERLWVLFPNANPDTLKVHISHIRKKLTPHGVEIGNVFGAGYFINADHKDLLRAAPPAPSVKGQRSELRVDA